MEIVILTQGRGDETEIFFNGQKQTDLIFFEINANTDRSNKVKLNLMRIVNGKYMPQHFYADDLRKFDEASKLKEGIDVIGSRKETNRS